MDRKLLVVLEHDEETRQPRLDPRLARRLRDKSARLETYRPLPPSTLARQAGDVDSYPLGPRRVSAAVTRPC